MHGENEQCQQIHAGLLFLKDICGWCRHQTSSARQENKTSLLTGSEVKLLLLMVPSSTACTHALVSLRDMRLPTPWPPPVQPVLMRKHCVPCLASFFWRRSAYLRVENSVDRPGGGHFFCGYIVR